MRASIGRALLKVLICGWLCVSLARFVHAEPRVALVVGNSAYTGDLGHLPNPVNDARLMGETLRQVGFDVVEVEDADLSALKQAVSDFGDKLAAAGTGATGLFFYAGHGVQMGGENYLIPVDSKLRKPKDLDLQAVPVTLVLKQMDFAQSTVNIVILDACRNNPLPDIGRGVTRGLAEIKVKPVGSFISFSTAPGEVAEDGNGVNSPYTAALAQAILRPGLDLAEVFRAVRKSVLKATNQKQTPWDSWSLTDPYYFIPPQDAAPLTGPSPTLNPPEGGTTQVAGMDPKEIELAFWNSIKDSSDPANFQAYLDQYPAGSFASLATIKLKALGAAPTAQPEAERTVTTVQTGAVVFTAVDQLVYTKNAGNLYEAPDLNAPLIARTQPATAIRAVGRSPDGMWWQIHLPNGRTAYAKAGDIDERPDAAQPAPVADAAPDQSAAVSAEQPAVDQPAGDEAAKQFFNLGEALFKQGDIKGARQAYDQAALRDPKDAQALLRRGQMALALDELDAAVADFDRAVAIDPAALEAQNDRILTRLALGDAAGAAKAADETQSVEPTFWSINAVAAYYMADRLDDAAAMAERVTRDDPTGARGWIWQAIVMKGQGRDGEAFDSLQTAMDAIGNRDWPVAIIEWMQGKRTEDRVMAAAKNAGGDPKLALRQIAEADFFLGEAAQTAGDRAAAERWLGQATDAQATHDLAPDLLAYAAAKALLAKMARE